MRLSQIGELSLLEQIRTRFEKQSRTIIVGIGDDAAVVKQGDASLLVTTDMMVEGIHFDLSFTTPFQIGFKLVSVNVSDIFAMGGKPRYLLLSLAMDKNTETSFIDKFFDGVQQAIKLYGVSLIGGDLSSSKRLMSLSATLIGYTKKHIKRSGAKLGDKIYVTGTLGDSACGLILLKKIKRPIPLESYNERAQRAKSKTHRVQNNYTLLHALCSKLLEGGLSCNVVEPLLRKHLLTEARDPKEFVRYATSMIDISDGLLIDLSRLCDESKVGARIYSKKIPLSNELKEAASYLGISPIKLALSGGEDYELLFTAPANKQVKALHIGEITESERAMIDSSGKKRIFSAEGYQHFGIQR
ncbi:MAG: thiamine-phosphate kinase [Nitrospirota bacterium]|nr:thiamine-phosphate kinase [Nitrospirota bacterium]MDH5768784.1 thiamine-phosphate kinase [Nitrospirota bacterium]